MFSLLLYGILPQVQPPQFHDFPHMGPPPGANEAAAVGFFVMLVGFLVGMILSVLLVVVPAWIVCKKAGLPGPLSLLLLVPVLNVFFFWILALINWPALENRGQGRESSPFQSG
jgi:hypothetical protein